MVVDLRHRSRHKGRCISVPQQICRACEDIAPLASMRPVDGRPADLGTMLNGRWMCQDEKRCLARYAARSKGDTLHAVVIPAEDWAAGDVVLITGNPRRAEERAAAHGACVVRWRVQTDYRKR